MEEEDILFKRSGRWLKIRVLGLFGVDSRIRKELFPEVSSGEEVGHVDESR